MLKAFEGAASSIFSLLREELTSSWKTKLAAAILRPSFRRVRTRMDYNEYNGAPLLGVNGLVVKGHGSSDAKALNSPARLVYSCAADKDYYHASSHLPARCERTALSEEAAGQRGLKRCATCFPQ